MLSLGRKTPVLEWAVGARAGTLCRTIGPARWYCDGLGLKKKERNGVERDRVERHFWSKRENVRTAMEEVARKFNIQQAGDWKRVSLADVQEVTGNGLTARYGVLELLQTAYPELEWLPEECRPRVERSHWESRETRDSFLRRVRRAIGAERWEEITSDDVVERGGRGLLQMYGGSLRRAIEESVTVTKDREGDNGHESEEKSATLPGRVSRGFWRSVENQREWLEATGKALGVREEREWATVSQSDIRKAGGGGLLNVYNGSWERARKELLPEAGERKRWWEREGEKERVLERLAESLDVTEVEDWRYVSKRQVVEKEEGRRLLALYGHSLHRCLEDMVPGYRRTVTCWSSAEERKTFLREMAAAHGIAKTEDWKDISAANVRAREGGSALLKRYNGSLGALLVDNLPNARLQDVRRRVTRGHWEGKESRRAFLERAAEELNVRSPGDWSSVTSAQIRAIGGSSFLDLYGGSLFAALRDTYGTSGASGTSDDNERLLSVSGSADFSSSEWELFRVRSVVPQQYWDDAHNVRRFLAYMQKELGLRTKMDWFRVSRQQVRSLHGGGLLTASRSWLDVLQASFPDEDWRELQSMTVAKKSAQRQLLERLVDIFPYQGRPATYLDDSSACAGSGRLLEFNASNPP